METQNLWPDFTTENIKSPRVILKEQAGYLMRNTNNVLSADIKTYAYQERFLHDFYIIAPAINNYRYKLFSVKHKIADYYPLTVITEIDIQVGEEEDNVETFQTPFEAHNEVEFMKLLSNVFNKPETIKVISSLLSQSLAE